jgi:hypothetical protein
MPNFSFPHWRKRLLYSSDFVCVCDFESFVALWAEKINTTFWTANRRKHFIGLLSFRKPISYDFSSVKERRFRISFVFRTEPTCRILFWNLHFFTRYCLRRLHFQKFYSIFLKRVFWIHVAVEQYLYDSMHFWHFPRVTANNRWLSTHLALSFYRTTKTSRYNILFGPRLVTYGWHDAVVA